MSSPVIGVVMCRDKLEGHATQTLQKKYPSVITHAGGLPTVLPHVLAEPSLLEQLLPKLDGIYLLDSSSDVQPHLYGKNGDEPDADPGCDLLNIAAINTALKRRIPIFVICRGSQELVVATGGSSHRRLCEQPELLEHREDPELPVEQQYIPSHGVQIRGGGLLPMLLPECSNFWINPLHGQGAKVASPWLCVEARSPDGLVEAVSAINHPFALGAQWYPEWNSSEYALPRISFEGFITAHQHHIVEKQRL